MQPGKGKRQARRADHATMRAVELTRLLHPAGVCDHADFVGEVALAMRDAFFWMRERMGQLIEFGQCRQIFDTPREEATTAFVSGARG